jgi:hypothetical protein
MTYSADSRKGNAGRVWVQPLTMGLWSVGLISTADTVSSAADMDDDGPDVGFGVWHSSANWFRHVFDTRVRFVQLSGESVARVSSTGRVRSFGKAGVVEVRAVLHNGNSAVATITVGDYAREGDFAVAEGMALFNRAVSFMTTQRRAELGEVAGWLMEHKVVGYVKLGENMEVVSDVVLGPEGEELIRDFLDSVPYSVTIRSTKTLVTFSSTAVSDMLGYGGQTFQARVEYRPSLWNPTYMELGGVVAPHWVLTASLPMP